MALVRLAAGERALAQSLCARPETRGCHCGECTTPRRRSSEISSRSRRACLVLGSRARIRTCRSDCSDVRRSSSSATDRSPTGQALISPESSTPEGHGATGCCGRWDTRLPQVTVCANAVAGVRATSSAIYGLGPTSASGSLNAAVSPGRIPPSEPADVSAGEMDLRSPCAPADEPHIRSGRVQQRHVEEVAALVVGRAVAARMPNQPIYDDLRSGLQHHFRGRIIIAERPTASMSRATVSLSEPNRRGLPRLLHGFAVEACCRHRGHLRLRVQRASAGVQGSHTMLLNLSRWLRSSNRTATMFTEQPGRGKHTLKSRAPRHRVVSRARHKLGRSPNEPR
jgi:hypothetical protein